jgi:putative membrane protein
MHQQMPDLLVILAACCFGILAGIITGLTPGVHINLVSAILLSLAPVIAMYAPLHLIAILIIAMAITHTFLDTIPSIFLGAPDDEKALGVLPGHRYLLHGNGLMAVKLCIIGGIMGTVLSAILFLPAILAIQHIDRIAKPFMFWILLGIILFTICKDRKRMLAIIVFCISGILGIITLRLPMREPLLPLLSGMFGIATLLYSINESQDIPLQRNECYTQIDCRRTIAGTALGTLAGGLTALLPGLSASAASATVSRMDLGDRGFLILLGALGSASFMLSLAAYLAIEKARNGAMAVIVQLTPLSAGIVVACIAAALLATGIAALLTLSLGRKATAWLPRIPYRSTCIGVIIFVIAIVYLRAGALGIAVLVTSTAAGLLPAALKTARGQAMGCLLLPILVYLW